jgi:Lipocalin-like domain
MNRRSMVSISALTALGFALVASSAVSAPKATVNKKQLVGTWTIVSADAYGPNPKGYLIFASDGHYSLQLQRPDIPKYASNNRTQGTPAEYKTTVEGSLSYFGTYSVNGTDLTLRIEGSTFPNWIGTEQRRENVSIVGGELKYTNTAPSGGGGAALLVWRRVK